MRWEPTSREELQLDVYDRVQQMTSTQRRLWDLVEVAPQKWQLHTWGDKGSGFWFVALVGQTVVWYNDIEHGFNRSQYTESGVIDRCQCNQDALHETIGHLLIELETGRASGSHFGPPEPVA